MKYDSKRIETACGNRDQALRDLGVGNLERETVAAWFARFAGDVSHLGRHTDPAYVGSNLGRMMPMAPTGQRSAAVWEEACRAYLEETFGGDLPEPTADARATQRTLEAGLQHFIDPSRFPFAARTQKR